jgi:Domain of unknown function (DUF4157)
MGKLAAPQAERPVHRAIKAAVPAAPSTRIPRSAGTVKLRPSQVPVPIGLSVIQESPVVPESAVQFCKAISAPGDELERDARSVADVVTKGGVLPSPTPGRAEQSHPCQAGGKQMPVQRASRRPGPDVSEHGLDQAMRAASAGGGTPLPSEVRGYFEPRFGHDFSRVRVHADEASAASAQAVGARAYTVGPDIVFGANEYSPDTADGRRLLAHELTHTVQQGAAPPVAGAARIAPSRAAPYVAREDDPSGGSAVGYVAVYLDTQAGGLGAAIDFHTANGTYRYRLEDIGDLEPGEFQVHAMVKGNDVQFTFDTATGQLFRFKYILEDKKPNPTTFFRHQSAVTFSVSADEPPQKQEPLAESAPGTEQLSPEEAMSKCASGDLADVMVFPYRGTRFGGAPLTVSRDGDDIVVKSYMYVKTNADFAEQTRTLPLEAFIGGVHIKPTDVVRVHTYEPHWYHLNITGDASGDIQDEFCVTGDGMLKIGEMSDKATLMNIGMTVIDAATLIVPVGKVGKIIGAPLLGGGRNVAIAGMLALREAAPTALAGIASQTSRVVIEEQVVGQLASRAVSETTSHMLIEFSEPLVSHAAQGAGDVVEHVAGAAIKRTITVTAVDSAGHQVVSTLTTPTGDKALDKEIDEAWSKTFDTSVSETPLTEGQGVVSLPPEVAAGFTREHVAAFHRILGKSFSNDEIKVLSDLWDAAVRPGDAASLTANNSRYLFDLQRNRFWTRVASDPQAKALFTDAGCQFSGGAPYYLLNGRRITITIDHIIERQTTPQLALTASNLQLSFSRENSVVLRLLNQLSPF